MLARAADETRALLGMSKVYSLWVNKMVKSREEAQSLREMLSFTKKKEADPLMDYLVSFRDRMGKARELLTDPALTAFFFVTLPESLPIAVITRDYLDYLDRKAQINLDREAEFLFIAALLIYIKSQMLLPRETDLAEHEDRGPDAVAVEQFEIARSSLHDIFIRIARPEGTETRAAEDGGHA